MRKQHITIIPMLLSLIAVTACNIDDGVGPPSSHNDWVAIDPIQCMGNPWEQDWLEANDWDYSSYPREWERQAEIIVNYYEKLGVTVFQILRVQTYDIVCLACSCPQGYTLYLRVSEDDVQFMLGLDYRREMPFKIWS